MARNKKKKNRGPIDRVLLIVILILIFWGLITVATVSFPTSLRSYGTPWYYLFNQLIRLGIGAVLAIVAFKLPLETIRKHSFWLLGGTLLLLLLVFVPKIGVKIGGASRWLNLGGFRLQPSEFLKITFLLYLANWLSKRKKDKEKKSFSQIFLPFIFMMAALLFILILQPDMSTLGIITISALVMYFIASTPLWHTLVITGSGLVGAIVLIKLEAYRMARLLVFLNPEKDPLGMGYQLRQALIAVGSGGLLGIGGGLSLGLSRQKLGFLPEPMTDSIFAIIGEEIGFIGCGLLISLFLVLLWRIFKIFKNAPSNSFEGLLAVGIGTWICFQTFFNIGGMLGLLPMGGVPLPFFSYGGSHIITELAAVGLLLNISKNKQS